MSDKKYFGVDSADLSPSASVPDEIAWKYDLAAKEDYRGDFEITLPSHAFWSDTASPSFNIETMWNEIQQESDERALAVVETWRRVGMLLETVKEQLLTQATALRKVWSSKAGDLFLERVGATLHSLDEWQEAAAQHVTTMTAVAGKIARTQQGMWNLHSSYQEEKAAGVDQDPVGFSAKTFSTSQSDAAAPLPELNQTFLVTELMQKYHVYAVHSLQGLANQMVEAAILDMEVGRVFKGPLEVNTDVPMPAPPAAPAAPPGAVPPTPASMPAGSVPPTPN
ncbi:MAG: hypothetical protein HKP61_01190, partial [Dactylosporangium sp.]|nr:hypothetical protein [Dactylosporangium sp.]NNJ59584.1 hypothetical protein [Dactylosporangium sp.]